MNFNHSQRGFAVSSVLLLLVVAGLMLTAVIRPNIVGMKQQSSQQQVQSVDEALQALLKNLVQNATIIKPDPASADFILLPPPMVITGTTRSLSNDANAYFAIGKLSTQLLNSVGNLQADKIGYCAYWQPVTLPANAPPLPLPPRGQNEFAFVQTAVTMDAAKNVPVIDLYYGDNLSGDLCNPTNARTDVTLRQQNIKRLRLTMDEAKKLLRSERAETANMPGQCEPGEVLTLGLDASVNTGTPQIGFVCKPLIAKMALRPTAAQAPCTNNQLLTSDGESVGVQCVDNQVRAIEAIGSSPVAPAGLYRAEAFLQPDLNAASNTMSSAPTVSATISCLPPQLNPTRTGYTGGGAVVLGQNGSYCVNVGNIGLSRYASGQLAELCPTDKRLVWLPGAFAGFSFTCEGVAPSDSSFGRLTVCDRALDTMNMKGYAAESNALVCSTISPPVTPFNPGFSYLNATIPGSCTDNMLLGTNGPNTLRCMNFADAFNTPFVTRVTLAWMQVLARVSNEVVPEQNPNAVRWALNWNPDTRTIEPVYPRNLYKNTGNKEPDPVACDAEMLKDPEKMKEAGCEDYYNSEIVIKCREKFQDLMKDDFVTYIREMQSCTGNPRYAEPAQTLQPQCEKAYGDEKYTSTATYIASMRSCMQDETFDMDERERGFFDKCIGYTAEGQFFYSVLNYNNTVRVCVEIEAGRMSNDPNPMLDPANNIGVTAPTSCEANGEVTQYYNEDGVTRTRCITQANIDKQCGEGEGGPFGVLYTSYQNITGQISNNPYGYPRDEILDFRPGSFCRGNQPGFSQLYAQCEEQMRNNEATIIVFEDHTSCMTVQEIRDACDSSAQYLPEASLSDPTIQNVWMRTREDIAEECRRSPQLWFGGNEGIAYIGQWNLYK